MTSVLLVAPIAIHQQRTGPAIRYWEFARALGAEQSVTLLVSNKDHPTHPDFAICTCAQDGLDALLAAHQVVVVQGPAIQQHPSLARILAAGRHYLVADLYDPITLEQLEIDPGGEAGRWLHLEYSALLSEQLRLSDFFLCASERQRDYWLGALAALGRINHATYDGSDLRRLIDVVPFGLPAEPPQAGAHVLKGVLPGIAPGDRIILWGGGLWDWLDPLTPIRAMERVGTRHPTARLVFFESDRHQPPMLDRAKGLAAELGLLGRHVLFADWLPPEQWGGCLLEADVGLSFHPASIETHFAFRTRLLDYIWAGLPIVAAEGDVLSDLVTRHGLGYIVRPGSVEALAQALIALLDEADARQCRGQAFRQIAEHFTWERVIEPLSHYCRQPWQAGDRDQGFYQHWHAAQRDRLLSDAAHAERCLAEAQTQSARQVDQLQAQVDDLTKRLQQSEARFQAAMHGRIMRLLTGIQRALRGHEQ
jgi:glycosyltransferase involved in cell wall biosynthesis